MSAETTPTEVIFGVSDFVAALNQTLDYAYGRVCIKGEIANFRISKNRWVYFSLKDESSSVAFFGSIYQMSMPLGDGMLVRVWGMPRLHNLYGFSVSFQQVQPIGQGSIKKSMLLLKAKLEAEGLFDVSRKRQLPWAPKRIALITSANSAAYADFIKILQQRWGGVEVGLYDVQVQGEAAIDQITAALAACNSAAELAEVVIMVRGGGSADDLAVFSCEPIVRAVASSRIPTLVAIGHEIDTSLAELAADVKASTPSNAAELLVPDKKHELQALQNAKRSLDSSLASPLSQLNNWLSLVKKQFNHFLLTSAEATATALGQRASLLKALDPEAPLKRGYGLVRWHKTGKILKSVSGVEPGSNVDIQLVDGILNTRVQ